MIGRGGRGTGIEAVACGSGGEAQRESILCESRSARPPAALSFSLSLLSFSTLPLFYPLLPRAILSSRICDHQHAKWIKFLDYTFRSPFLYPLPIPIPGRLSRPSPSPRSRRRPVSRRPYPRLFLRTYEYLYTRTVSLHPCFRPLFLFTFFVPLLFFQKKDPAFFHPALPPPWAIFPNLAILRRTDAPYQLF